MQLINKKGRVYSTPSVNKKGFPENRFQRRLDIRQRWS